MLKTGIADDRARRIPGQVGLEVMKHLIADKRQESNKRVLDVYRLLRMRGYIGRGGPERARVTTMATWYGVRAAEVGGGPLKKGWRKKKGGGGSRPTQGRCFFVFSLVSAGQGTHVVVRTEHRSSLLQERCVKQDAGGTGMGIMLCM